ncbi:hypothetical protein SEVIR_6G244750v4 [Setaria viridis]
MRYYCQKRYYAKQVWYSVDQMTGNASLMPVPGSSMMDWWLLWRRSFHGARKKGLDTTTILVSWRVWKERNSRVFNRDPEQTPQQLAAAIAEEAALWFAAGAHCLSSLGWQFDSL